MEHTYEYRVIKQVDGERMYFSYNGWTKTMFTASVFNKPQALVLASEQDAEVWQFDTVGGQLIVTTI